ncbi:MAG: HD domain-containing protein [Egibacteraceae bacterium]
MTTRLADIVGLLEELGDLKRVRVAGRDGSLAEQAFRRAWGALAAGTPPEEVAQTEIAAAVAATRLGGIDAAVLRAGGLAPGEIEAVLRRGLAAVAAPLDLSTRQWLDEGLRRPPPAGGTGTAPPPADRARTTPPPADRARTTPPPADRAGTTPPPADRAGTTPPFVEALIAQPRAGATCPGRPRLMLEPPESHGDHCWAVAVYGGLLAPRFAADRGEVFLTGLAHHLHNAVLPDSGSASEVLLGEYAAPLMRTLTAAQLRVLAEPLRGRVAAALDMIAAAEVPAARAFHAADVLDRVLQMRHYARAAAFTLDQALDDLDLVHPGPVQPFHHKVLASAGLR